MPGLCCIGLFGFLSRADRGVRIEWIREPSCALIVCCISPTSVHHRQDYVCLLECGKPLELQASVTEDGREAGTHTMMPSFPFDKSTDLDRQDAISGAPLAIDETVNKSSKFGRSLIMSQTPRNSNASLDRQITHQPGPKSVCSELVPI